MIFKVCGLKFPPPFPTNTFPLSLLALILIFYLYFMVTQFVPPLTLDIYSHQHQTPPPPPPPPPLFPHGSIIFPISLYIPSFTLCHFLTPLTSPDTSTPYKTLSLPYRNIGITTCPMWKDGGPRKIVFDIKLTSHTW